MDTKKINQWQPFEYIPKQASEDLLKKHWELEVAIEKEFQPEDPVPSFEAFKDSMTVETPLWDWRPYVLFDQEKIIGSAELGFTGKNSPDYQQNKHIGHFYITVHKDWRRRGIGTSFLKHVIKDALELGITTIESGSRRESGINFCKKLGGKEYSSSLVLKLYMKDIDWDMVEGWAEAGRQSNPEISTEIVNSISDEYFKEFAILTQNLSIEAEEMTKSENKTCLENAEGDLRNFIKYLHDIGSKTTYVIMHKHGVGMIGMTETFFNPNKPYLIEQGMTGVLKNHRCKGIGRWLKAEMLLFAREHFKEILFIRTGNSTVNDAMIKINDQLGFKAIPTCIDFRFDAQDLAKKLGIVNE